MATKTFKPPTHENEDGVERPGAHDLKATVTPEVSDASDAAWREAYGATRHQNQASASHPHLGETHAPLQQLQRQALRLFGNVNPDVVIGETQEAFIAFANMVIEDLRAHPYFQGPEMDYYVHVSERRPIPDIIMTAGLLAYYAEQRESKRAERLMKSYQQRMNTVLYNRAYGSGPIELVGVDQ